MKRVEVPGMGVVEFPDSMTNQQIAAALRQRFSAQPAGTATSAGLAGAGERMLSNLMELPQLPGRAMNAAADFLNQPLSIGGVNLGGAPPEGPGVLASDFRFGRVPLPTGRQVAAAIETPVQVVMAGQSLADAFGQRMQARTQMAEQRPGATAVGQFAGDAATLAMGRAPFVRPGGGGMFDAPVRRGVEAVSRALSGPNAGRVSRTLGDWANSGAIKALAQGAGRSVEAGLEGAGLSMLQDGDPLETAGYAAGMQAGTSVLNSFFDAESSLLPQRFQRTFTGRVAAAAATAFATGSLIQFFKSAAPGGEDRLMDSLESGYSKVIFGAALGAASSLIGGRPSGTGMFQRFPDVMDALQTLPRTSIIKLAQSAAEDPVVERAVQNAPYLGDSDAKRYLDAVTSENPGAAVRDLIDTVPRIGNKLTAPDQRLATIPVRED